MGTAQALSRLRETLGSKVTGGYGLNRVCGLHVGGPAEIYVDCETYQDLRRAMGILDAHGCPWVVLGRGCSVLPGQQGYGGAVLVLGTGFRTFSFEDGDLLKVGAGTPLQRVVTEAFKRGLGGLEFVAGVPGTMGGAVSMNAGTASLWIGRSVAEVVTYRPGTGIVRYAGGDVDWRYRRSSIPADEVILEVTLGMHRWDPDEIRRATQSMLARRQEAQPLDATCVGPIFRNLPGTHVADLVRGCGLAGCSIGGAALSERHPNFIVNEGNATARDAWDLVARVHDEVSQRYGIDLRPEVRFLGCNR